MRNKNRFTRLILVLLTLILISSVTFFAAAQATPETAAPAPTGMMTSNGIWLQPGMALPVYKFIPQTVTGDGSVAVASLFSSIGRQAALEEDVVNGRPRFTIVNTQTNSILERYGATGGFNAFNPAEAFNEESRGGINPAQAQYQACLFLLSNQIFPDNNDIGTPNVQFCDFNFGQHNPYRVSLIKAAAADSAGRALQQETVIGAVVQVPMFVKTGRYSQTPTVPLGGAGGHISLLFKTTDVTEGGFSLDDSVPGLGAVAMPFFSRSLEFIANIPTRDIESARQQVEQAVRDAYPDADAVNVPVPALVYDAPDISQTQLGLEPMLEFEGIEVELDGEVIVLRSIMVSALQEGSYGPEVAITSPADGSTFTPGTAVALTGSIAGGQSPYTYTWSSGDGSLLITGTLSVSGTVNATATDLEVLSHAGFPAGIVVQLEVEDANGAVRQAAITLYPSVAPSAFLPALLNNSGPAANAAANAPAPSSASVPEAITAVYRFGVHAGSDYPPYGPGGSDLPGVVPDATGFRTKMIAYGWTSTYNWWNANAWEKDWRDCSLGGIDCTAGVDRVDFAYYAGHGGAGGLSLPSNKDSTWFDGNKARYSTLRWAGFASCQTLRVQGYAAGSEPIRRWFGAFQGAHMLLGYNGNMADVAFGPRFVDNMRPVTFFGVTLSQLSIREAWLKTVFDMNAGKPAYIYAVGTNGVNPVNNKLPRSGDPALPRPFPVASYHWVWWEF